MVSDLSTISVILLDVEQAPAEFIRWLKNLMEEENLGIRAFARKLGVSHPTISEMVTYGSKPSFETILAIAKAYNKDPVQLLRCAGLLPESNNIFNEELNHLYVQLPARDQREIIEIIRSKIDLKQKVAAELKERYAAVPKSDVKALLDFVEEVLSEIGYTRV